MATGKRAESVEYEALVNIDHTGDGCIHPAGSIIRLDHLSPERIQRLINRGYVKPVERPIGPPEPADKAE